MRLFVEATELPNLKTWFIAQESEALILGVKTKGLIVENFQLQTEFPDNLEEFDGHNWHLLFEDKYTPVYYTLGGVPILPKCIRNSQAKKDASTLNSSMIYVIIILLIWLIVGWAI
ncbi:hypothetical protein PR1_25 [Providencia phage vB_PreS_PR1]|uniref:Uncharacterized protein n=1 Tax=Providencia phage vB_PreS_PR1 TaxID=1931407 RepID=A0A1S6KV64_9CAUD|nr:hypothetical protein FDH30_gp026 [Providencia phage vB_PreS_PR1]AQT25301.1 hypothetical protein PR1_25 [Providencia phage vB_PreS_PR1]